MNSLLGGKLRDLREERGLTQEQIAGKLGMSRQKYARIENGVSDITLEVLTKVAKIFGVSVSGITGILDKEPVVAYRRSDGGQGSIDTVYAMLDLFYANKHAYEKVHAGEFE